MRPQETRSVPLTANMTVEEYFASERLGFSNYGAMFHAAAFWLCMAIVFTEFLE